VYKAVLLLAPVLLAAQPATLPVERLQAIEQVITTEMARNTIPGLTVAIGSAAGLRWSNGYGMADLENLVPATALTEIRLGSISKPITAVAVMQLVEKDKIQLDAPIQRYVPTFPQKPWPLTVRQLLGHLGGVRHYVGREELDSTRHYTDRITPLKIFQDDPLLFEPGTKYSYTSYGFNLLGAAVENVARVAFVDYLRANIFQPAGMTHISPDDVYEIIPHRARGYRLSETKQLQNCSLADTSNKVPGGGLISTAGDLVSFALALNAGKLVKPATRDLMFAVQKFASGEPSTYGMGWQIAQFEGRKMVAHGGGQQGISTYLMLFPQDGLALAVMLNREAAPAGRIANQIASVMLR
jgi:CubicO group peptidase (beta-lactamase class C family)